MNFLQGGFIPNSRYKNKILLRSFQILILFHLLESVFYVSPGLFPKMLICPCLCKWLTFKEDENTKSFLLMSSEHCKEDSVIKIIVGLFLLLVLIFFVHKLCLVLFHYFMLTSCMIVPISQLFFHDVREKFLGLF